MKLTKRNIDKLTLPVKAKRYSKIFHDDALRGFALRVTSQGAKTFIINIKVAGKVVRTNIGRYPEFTVDEARKRAKVLLGQLADGIKPVKKKPIAEQGITLKFAYDDYLKTRKTLSPKSRQDYDSLMLNIFVDWQAILLKDITREMVSTTYATVGQRSQARATNAFKLLSAIFNFAVYQYADREDEAISENPVVVLTQTRSWFAKKRRSSKIDHDQLPRWFQAVNSLRLNTYNSIEISVKYYLVLILFTGLRKEEAASLVWEDAATPEEIANKEISYISLKDKMLFINKTKNKVEHALPLSDYIFDVFKQYRKTNASRFVFPGVGGGSYIKEPRKVIKKVIALSNVSFMLHDLRRTFATMANEIGTPDYTIKRLLNHKTGSSDVTAGYIVNDLKYLREPVNRIAHYMLEIIKKENKED